MGSEWEIDSGLFFVILKILSQYLNTLGKKLVKIGQQDRDSENLSITYKDLNNIFFYEPLINNEPIELPEMEKQNFIDFSNIITYLA